MIPEKDQAKKPEVCLILDNIRSVYNVGSIFRTAETLGIVKIYCIGTTPTPTDRFGRKRKDLAKVALGAEDILKWEHVGTTGEDGLVEARALIKKLKKEGFKMIALEQSPKAVDYKEVSLSSSAGAASGGGVKVAIILGNEVEGVSPMLLKLADTIAEIPMLGKKESLNVSVASGIFLYRLLDVVYKGRR